MKKIFISLTLFVPVLASICAMDNKSTSQNNNLKNAEPQIIKEQVEEKVKMLQKKIIELTEQDSFLAERGAGVFVKILGELTECKKNLHLTTSLEKLTRMLIMLEIRENEINALQVANSYYSRLIKGMKETGLLIWYNADTTILACLIEAFSNFGKTLSFQQDNFKSVFYSVISIGLIIGIVMHYINR